MTLAKALQVAAGNSQESADVAEAIDFDGTTDSLSSGSAIPGYTGTFSFWLWVPSGSAQPVYRELMTSGLEAVKFSHDGSGTLSMTFWNSNSGRTQAGTVSVAVAVNTWANILFSVDRTAAGSFPVYVNDIQSGTLTLSQDALAARNNVTLPRNSGSPSHGKLRLSNFLVINGTYDFSNVTNRRLFITADLKPAADQAALNPLIYLPLNDPTAPGFNAGTGGNFTLTGTVARSGRGPNQYNAPYSDLDGTADYLSRTSLSGIADGKQLTVNFCANIDTFTTGFVLVFSTTSYFRVYFASNAITINALNAAGSTILSASYSIGSAVNRNYSIQISCDLSDTNKRHMIVNGQAVAATWSTYTNDNIDFTHTTYQVGRYSTNQYFNGRLGALWFNTSYIDLSVASNLAKFVTGTGIDAKPVDLGASGELPTGTSPLIYLPMYGNNAGKNYGTGGDFTVNSGPYTGARGPNEFWGNKADFNGTTGYLSRTSALSGIADSKTFSVSFNYNPDTIPAGQDYIFAMSNGSSSRGIFIQLSSNNLRFFAYDSAGNNILQAAVTSPTLVAGTNYSVQASVDLANTSNRSIYINGTVATVTWSTYTNNTINHTASTQRIGAAADGSAVDFIDGKLSEFYFTTEYIDFSQEANRLKFRDAFGNPVNLTQQIEDAAIPSPAIYMRFPPTSFGTNSGTGGDFTVNGTITDGGQL